MEEEIVRAIRGGATKLAAIMAVVSETDDRKVDRALQRCRRKGLVKYVNQRDGWRVVEVKS